LGKGLAYGDYEPVLFSDAEEEYPIEHLSIQREIKSVLQYQ
jgi:hypothetical protein